MRPEGWRWGFQYFSLDGKSIRLKGSFRGIAIRRRMIPIDSFLSNNRLESESMADQVTDLRYYATRCGIADLKNTLTRIRIVPALNNGNMH